MMTWKSSNYGHGRRRTPLGFGFLLFLASGPVSAFAFTAVPSLARSAAAAAAAAASASLSSSSLRSTLDEPKTSSRSRRGDVREMSEQMSSIREQMMEDEDTRLMMDALRGRNINDDDSAAAGLEMRLSDVGETGGLATEYDPAGLKAFFRPRPLVAARRVGQVFSALSGYLGCVLKDALAGKMEDPEAEVNRVRVLRESITSLGPFFIKLGQALSIRPDILSPRSMVELQRLCDKVPSYPSDIAFDTIQRELGKSMDELYSDITPEPVAAASLGQVYKATLRETGDTVAVKVQRPGVLETVSLDLYLARELGLLLKKLPGGLASRLDAVALLDEFAYRFYQELDYNLECENGNKIREQMQVLPMVVIPKNYPTYTSRRVHTAQWVEGEKLSQSKADDVGALVNLGVIAYLTQLLEFGFFHADPHPGNMMRTPDGKLVILDFGLMTEVNENQKYGMIEAIAHLINRDYQEIGQDFINLDFIPKGTDTKPIVPALTKVFDAALAGGGAKSINFQELAADLAQITFDYPFRIPPYFALVIRAISVLEGIALVGNPQFAIIDEAYPYIARRLMTDSSPRLKAALTYMVYGRDGTFDAERVIDLLQALEKFTAVRDEGDGSAFKQDGMRGGRDMGTAGTFAGTKEVRSSPRHNASAAFLSPPFSSRRWTSATVWETKSTPSPKKTPRRTVAKRTGTRSARPFASSSPRRAPSSANFCWRRRWAPPTLWDGTPSTICCEA
uniref:Protein kinase domain-containing protein n=1 Tax=Corethron hystrix TaxID=216773 RepID=A0A7S1B859_9STRA|mmetsp:Transcript_15547/g.34954  ORF Transcript_15547/g.34954 Transcript_15547/m.34954 type:complete len:735 (+) Transcript_15547:186-2390(+)